MSKLFCLVQMNGSDPQLSREDTPYAGHVHIGNLNHQFGAYMVSGTGAQLVAINALPQVVGIVAVTESGGVRWAELDGVIAAGVRTKLNAWLSSRGYPNIPAGWTYKQVIREVFRRLNDKFEFDLFDVAEI